MTKAKAKSTVPLETRLLGGLVFNAKPFWAAMGNLESFFLRDSLDEIQINAPVYITGLARSGTTILLEMLAEHSQTASHTYQDFPMLYTPYWWSWFLNTAKGGAGSAGVLEERTHNDGICVGPGSPEAMEEPLWMHFFGHLHDSSCSNVLDAKVEHLDFESFYPDHIKKIMLARKATRYVAKGNYNLARIKYLSKLFPDARFVIPVRDPVMHIASLCKQQRLFEKLETEDPLVLEHMCRVGHYEFGLNWMPVNYGRSKVTQEILAAWKEGQKIKAWALYWNDVHQYLLELFEDAVLKNSILVVGYDALCSKSEKWVPTIFEHCGLNPEQGVVEKYIAKLKPPDYYSHTFSDDELEMIEELTSNTVERLNL